MRMLVEGNPPKRRRKKRRRTAAQKRATAKMIAANRKRRRTKATAKKGRRRVARRVTKRRRVATMARRRRRSTRRRAVARRRRPAVRRRRRVTRRARTVTVGGRVYRNPGMVQMLTRGVGDAVVAVAGKTAARFIGSKLPRFVAPPATPGAFDAGGAINAAIAALGIGFIGSKVGLGGDRVRIAVQGALQAPIEAVVNPLLTKAGLTGYSAPRAIGAYSQPRLMAGYSAAPGGVVRAAGMAGMDDEFGYENSNGN